MGKPKIMLLAPSSGRRPTCGSSSASPAGAARAMPSTPQCKKALLVAAMAGRAAAGAYERA
jgi:hypothetical protein